MDAFITGSRAYGKPRPNSDVDLVIRVDQKTADLLLAFSDSSDDGSIRFGSLNLIVCTDNPTYWVWKNGTESLKEQKRTTGPVSKAEAKEFLDEMRRKEGITYNGESGGDWNKRLKNEIPLGDGTGELYDSDHTGLKDRPGGVYDSNYEEELWLKGKRYYPPEDELPF